MSLLKRLAGQTALYGLSSMIGRVITFLLVPAYTLLLPTPSEYGVVTELYAYVAFFNILFLYGMETTYFRFANKEGAEEQPIFNHILTQILLTSTALTLLLILFSDSITTYLQYSANEPEELVEEVHYKASYVWYIILILFTDAALAIPFARLRMKNKALLFAGIKLATVFMTVFLNALFLWILPAILKSPDVSAETKEVILNVYDPSDLVSYIFLSNLIANALQFPFLWKAFKGFRFTWISSMVSPLLNYGIPLMVMGLAGMVNEMLDRIILKAVLPDNFYKGKSTLYALGVYGACYKLSMFISLAVQAFRYAAEPFFFSQAKDKKSPVLFADVMKWFVLVCVAMFLFISVNLDWIKYFLANPAYWEGLYVVPILLMANLFLGVYYNLAIWFKLTDKTYWGTYISIGGALFTIGGNLLLIPILGYLGAAWVTLACYALMAIVSYWLGQKHYPIPYEALKMLAWIVSASAIVYAIFRSEMESGWTKSILSNGAILIWLFFVLLLEKARIRSKGN